MVSVHKKIKMLVNAQHPSPGAGKVPFVYQPCLMHWLHLPKMTAEQESRLLTRSPYYDERLLMKLNYRSRPAVPGVQIGSDGSLWPS